MCAPDSEKIAKAIGVAECRQSLTQIFIILYMQLVTILYSWVTFHKQATRSFIVL